MSTATPARDPYQRHRAAAAASRTETRRRLLEAADTLFRQRGYPATTVAAIAQQAKVSVQTLYLAWGSKSALLRAAADAASSGSNLPLGPEDWRTHLTNQLAEDAGHDPGAAASLAAVSRLFVTVAERTAPYWRMHRDAAPTDPDVADDWQAMVAGRRQTMTLIADALPRIGLRPEVTSPTLADTLWALANPDVYDLLTTSGGYSPADYQEWLSSTLVAALCQHPPAGSRTERRRDE
ncbi:MAG: TetR/AcrR family transcriptional regulator [Janthinobacterium lividum]